jgi:flagellar FliJ protein
MTDLQPLLILLGQHERARDTALAEHQRTIVASRAAAEQAAQLLTYRRDYQQRWSTQFQSHGTMDLVHCYQSFVERLTQAVEQQQTLAEHAQRQVAGALTKLRTVELRCASVQKLIERRTLEARLDADRRDQKQTDEFAARVAWDRIGGPAGRL